MKLVDAPTDAIVCWALPGEFWHCSGPLEVKVAESLYDQLPEGHRMMIAGQSLAALLRSAFRVQKTRNGEPANASGD